MLPLREVAAEGAPDDPHVDVAGGDRFHDPLRRRSRGPRVRLRESDDVPEHSAALERVGRRRVAAGVREGMEAYAQLSQRRVVEGPQMDVLVCRVDEYVRRSIIRLRREHLVVTRRNTHDEVAFLRLQGATDEAAPLGFEGVPERRVHLAGEQLRDPVLESFLLLVGEGKVVGVRANAKLALRRRRSREQKNGDRGCPLPVADSSHGTPLRAA